MNDLDPIIARRPARRADLAAWYRELITAAEAAGVRVADLATRLGCTRETIYAWKRRQQRQEAGSGMVPAVRAERLGRTQASGLMRVQVTNPPSVTDPDGGRLEVHLANGRVVLVPRIFDPETLASAVAALDRC